MITIRKLLLLSASASALTASVAYAQDDMGAPARATSSGGASVDEVIVTARRKEESLQEVPVAVTAISSRELEARSVRGVSDLAQIAPGLNIGEGNRGAGVPIVNLRGQENIGTAITNDPAVGFYFDEVYLGRSAGALVTTMDDMSSVQVLRGPQGTLFGRNNTGGAILLTPKRPGLDGLHGQVTLNGGSRNHVEGSAVLDLGIVPDKFGIRGFYKKVRQDGIGRSVITGIKSFGNKNRDNGRVTARFKPADNFTADFTYDFSNINETGPFTQSIVPFAGLGYYENRQGLPNPTYVVKTDGYTFRGEFVVSPDLTVKTIVGRRLITTDMRNDVDGGPAISVDVRQFMHQGQWTAEVQASGATLHDAGWLTELSYTGGFFYFTESGTDGSSLPLPAGLNPLTAARYLVNFADNESAAGYLQLEANHDDRFFLTGGARYTKDKRDLKITALGTGRCTLLVLPAGTPASACFQSGSASFGYWSYTAGVRYQVTPDANIYLKYDKGQRAGGLDDTPTSIDPFFPEVVKSLELGGKADFLDRRLRLNVAAYHAKVDNVQRTTLLSAPDGSPYSSVFNAAKSRVQGIEVEAVVRPVEGLTLEGTLGLTDANYKEFADVRPGPTRGSDLSGLIYANSPKTTYTLAASYSTEMSDVGRLNMRVDYYHRSKTWFDPFNDPRTVQNPYGLLNARIQLDVENAPFGEGFSIAAYGRNITGTKYNSWGVTAAGGVNVRSDNRRSYGVEVKVGF